MYIALHSTHAQPYMLHLFAYANPNKQPNQQKCKHNFFSPTHAHYCNTEVCGTQNNNNCCVVFLFLHINALIMRLLSTQHTVAPSTDECWGEKQVLLVCQAWDEWIGLPASSEQNLGEQKKKKLPCGSAQRSVSVSAEHCSVSVTL